MDFDLDADQRERLELLRSAVAGAADGDDHGHYSQTLDSALRSEPRLTGEALTLLDRILLVEEAARLAAPIGATATLLLEGFLDTVRPPGAMAIRDTDPDTPVRLGASATSLLELEEDSARFGPVLASDVVPVASGFGDGYAAVRSEESLPVSWTGKLSPSDSHRLGLVAELAGAARAALEFTAGYMREREQFGTPLAGFQALRHRLSERAVDMEGVSALARYAADRADTPAVAAAVVHAAQTASTIVPELHQLCGARGFLKDFGLATHTMRVEALRVELGGVRTAAIRHADAAWR